MNPRSPILHAIVAFVLTIVPVDLLASWTVALSAAAVHAPQAGSFDPGAYARYRGRVAVSSIPG